MKVFFLIIILLYLLLTPFYIFASGLPQPADIVVSIGVIVFLFWKKNKKTINLPIVKSLFRFIYLVCFINIFYWFYFFAIKGIDNNMYFVPLFYIFNGFFFLFFLTILIDDGKLNKKFINILSFTILISLSIQFILALIGYQFASGEESYRNSLFFNNPNQLGYFSLLMLSLFTVLPSVFRKNIFILMLLIFITSFLILYSGSRAALVGVLLLSAFLFYLEGFKFKFNSFIILIFAIFFIPIFLESNFFKENIDLIQNRTERNLNTNISEAQIRGFDRFWIHPEYIIYGSGEGMYERFNSYHHLELHSGFGTILFSYGILGLVLFLSFFYKIIKKNPFFLMILMSPVLTYNITHHGFRTSLFWLLLASVYLLSFSNIYNKSDV